MEKVYIGEVEAWEVALERGIEELPKKGFEVLTVYAIAENRPEVALGKDEKGFFIR